MKKNNELLDDLLRNLEDPDMDGKALQELAGAGEPWGPEHETHQQQSRAQFADRVTAAAFEARARSGSKKQKSQREEAHEEQSLAYFMPRMFRWVALAGAAAVLILLILTWSRYKSIDADAIAGISELSIGDVFAETLF
jgi:hypothetical protein